MGNGDSIPGWSTDPFTATSVPVLRREMDILCRMLADEANTEPLRLILCGEVRVGKSSLVNSIMTAIKGRLVQAANFGGAQTNVTHKYTEHQLSAEDTLRARTPIVMCDVIGFPNKSSSEAYAQAVQGAVSGIFNSKENMDVQQAAAMETRDRIKKTAACIIFVFDATQVKGLGGQPVLKNLLSTLEFANREGIPVAAILTKCDLLDRSVAENIKTLYKSYHVRQARFQLHEKFERFPLNCIFPVVNYTHQSEAEDMMSIPTLYAITKIVSIVWDRLSTVN